jgi:hypothetical protein
MRLTKARRTSGWVIAAAVVMGSGYLVAQQTPTFRAEVTHVTTDVIPRDASGRFIPDLGKGDFTVL